jgi:hypothetical protein
MMGKMPRGAIPAPRSKLAAAEPYRPGADAEVFVPSGPFPRPNHELVAATPYRAHDGAPASFLAWPIEISSWATGDAGDSLWAEEAFAKACAEPQVFVADDVVRRAARQCGSSNFAAFMYTHGFQMERRSYLSGPFHSVDWTSSAVLHGAIATSGPVKIGVASADLGSSHPGRVTPGTSGWAVFGLSAGQPEDHCAGLCGYGTLGALVDLFERHGVQVQVPSGMPTGPCYAMFTSGSIGIIDRQSLMNITSEAWVRTPTTIVRNLDEPVDGRGV